MLGVHKALVLLRKIPKNRVTTYKALAKKCRTSPRAIGCVMRNNKEPKKYPCYKVIKSSGEVGGYCGSAKGKNVRKKISLLKHDGIKVIKNKVDKRYFYKFT